MWSTGVTIVHYIVSLSELTAFLKLLTLILLTWTIWRAPTNASKWRMGFNSAFKGLNKEEQYTSFMAKYKAVVI